jgi:predicted naringenin-chalcone synthase
VTDKDSRRVLLCDFAPHQVAHVIEQERTLDWLARAHARSQATRDRLSEGQRVDLEGSMRRRLARFGCSPRDIHRRGTMLDDFLHDRWDEMKIYGLAADPRGHGTAARSAVFAELAGAHLDESYAPDAAAPDDLIHVTCTGYVSPSAAQELVARRGWGEKTRVTHAYHMGCYASIPAVRLAAGQVAMGSRRADIVHTELCTLHLDPSDHSPEQLVVQSLFADGLIRYAARPDEGQAAGLSVLALDEMIVPDSSESMRWAIGDHGMRMTLARDVPDRIAGPLGGFVRALFEKSGIRPEAGMADALFAVHPGGPKIIDGVAEVLRLREDQIGASRAVLHEHGNMSSATLPHVWARIAEDENVSGGALVVSLAFGPGLTLCGAVYRKR